MKKKYSNFILDRDGIINEIVLRNGKVSSPREFGEFKFLKASKYFLSKLVSSKKNIFIATNQPDISRDLLKAKDLEAMHSEINSKLNVKEILICPHDDYHNCSCRKPKPGMILKIIEDYKLQKSNTCFIGDSQKDIEAGNQANIDSYYFKTDYNFDLSSLDLKYKEFKSFQEIIELI